MVWEKVWLEVAWTIRRVGDRVGEGQGTLPYPVTHPPNGSCYFEPNLFLYHFLFLVHSTHIYLPTKMEECSETLAFKLQMPGNYSEESIQHTEHRESLKSRIQCICSPEATVFPTVPFQSNLQQFHDNPRHWSIVQSISVINLNICQGHKQAYFCYSIPVCNIHTFYLLFTY